VNIIAYIDHAETEITIFGIGSRVFLCRPIGSIIAFTAYDDCVSSPNTIEFSSRQWNDGDGTITVIR
jgi:hypothetical protein